MPIIQYRGEWKVDQKNPLVDRGLGNGCFNVFWKLLI